MTGQFKVTKMHSWMPEEMLLIVGCNYTVESYFEHLLTSKSLNHTGEEHDNNFLSPDSLEKI